MEVSSWEIIYFYGGWVPLPCLITIIHHPIAGIPNVQPKLESVNCWVLPFYRFTSSNGWSAFFINADFPPVSSNMAGRWEISELAVEVDKSSN